MAASRRIYWDACAWIALIQQEKILDDKGQVTEDRYSMCRSVVQVAEKGPIEIATSTLSLAEVNKNPADAKSGEDKIAAYFERDYVLLVNLDTAVGERARLLMQSGFAGLRPADACHLATAVTASVEEFHTFDKRLLNLNGLITKLDGTKLTISKPDPGGPPIPLLAALVKQPAASAPAPVVADVPSLPPWVGFRKIDLDTDAPLPAPPAPRSPELDIPPLEADEVPSPPPEPSPTGSAPQQTEKGAPPDVASPQAATSAPNE
jgi:predicted nucleic acid-binding protein